MRVAVISDIHGNLHALEAVLAELEREQPDEIWCLGDLVGYGPQPNRCCEAVAARAELCLAGNHDLGVLGSIDLEEFSPDAARSARWTRERARRRRAHLARGRSSPAAERDGRRAVPRQPARPGLGVRAQRRGGRGHARADERAGRARRPQHVALAIAPRDAALAAARAGRHEVELDGATLAAQPGLGRPAARRRPARGVPLLDLDQARPSSGASTTPSRDAGGDQEARLPARSPSDSPWRSDPPVSTSA